MMKRTISILGCLLMCISGFCQKSDIQALAARTANGRVSLDFSFYPSGKPESTVRGSLAVQGNCFRIDTGGQAIVSDGQTCWTVNASSQEVYIEKGGQLPSPSSLVSLMSEIAKLPDGYRGVFTLPEDGRKYNFELRNIKTGAPSGNAGEFKFNPDKLQDDWVVTDLR